MNCQRFQNQLYEYVEGSLPPRAKLAAEKHLSGCPLCRGLVNREVRVGRILYRELQKAAGPLVLSSDVPNRVLAALNRNAAPKRHDSLLVSLWRQLFWPVAATACLLAVGLFIAIQTQKHRTALSPAPLGQQAISVNASYTVPTYTFRREGNLVIDAVTFQTNTVRQTLWADANAESESKQQERRKSL
ncbi:MAG TPA: zf-HC2 domain-containing protein [Clostridia bacterium]|nr:zf-HC2 domain-containing protein [Clostridia bacterium]